MKHSTIKQKGFHLVEILITLTIIGILTTIAIPSYTHHFQTEARLEAATTLSKLVLALEQYAIENQGYQGATLEKLHFPARIANERYELLLQSVTVTNYQIEARPIGKQINDTQCASLILTTNGEKKITGTSTPEICW